MREAALAAALAPRKPRYLAWERALEEEVLRIDVIRSVKVALQRGIKDQMPDFNKHKQTEVCMCVNTLAPLRAIALPSLLLPPHLCANATSQVLLAFSGRGFLCVLAFLLLRAAPCVLGYSYGRQGGRRGD